MNWTDDAARLRAHAERLVDRSEATIDRADREDRELTAEESRAITRRLQQTDALMNQACELEDAEPVHRGGALSDPPRAGGSPRSRAISTQGTAHQLAALPTEATGRDAVLNAMSLSARASTGPFADFGAFARAVRTNHPQLYNYDYIVGGNEGTGADGGFLVPTQWAYDLMRLALEAEVVRLRALVLPMASSQLVLPAFDNTDRSTGAYGGIGANTTGETKVITPSKPKLRTLTLTATKIAILVPVSNELLEDSGPALATLLTAHLAEALAHSVDAQLLAGTGAGEPMGILNAAAALTVAKEANQSASTVTVNNLASMLTRLDPASFKRAIWICHPGVVAQLLTLQMRVTNIAATENVGGWGPSWFQLAPDGQMALLGRPLVTSDQLPVLGTEGDIMLADLSRYVVGIVGGAPRLAVDSSVAFDRDMTLFRLTIRLDGAPALHAPITPRHGPMVSSFVKLETRS